jgi:hypothetical protein
MRPENAGFENVYCVDDQEFHITSKSGRLIFTAIDQHGGKTRIKIKPIRDSQFATANSRQFAADIRNGRSGQKRMLPGYLGANALQLWMNRLFEGPGLSSRFLEVNFFASRKKTFTLKAC